MEGLSRRDSAVVAQECLLKARSKLDSLDPSDPEYKIKKNAIEFEIHTCETELAGSSMTNFSTHPGHTNQQLDTNNFTFPANIYNLPTLPIRDTHNRPQSSSAALSQPTDFSACSGAGQNGLYGYFASDGALLDQTFNSTMPGPWNFDGSIDNLPSSTASPRQTDDFSGSASTSSPESTFAMPRKRKRPDLSLTSAALDRRNKSLRTSQSPCVTGNITPASSDSLPEDVLAFLGNSPKKSMKKLCEEQLQKERQAQERNRIMQRDEELARSLQQQDGFPEWPSSSIQSEANNLPRTPSQTVLDQNGRYQRPTPMPSTPLSVGTTGFAPSPTPVTAGPSNYGDSYRPSHPRLSSDSTGSPLFGSAIKKEEPKYYSYTNTGPYRNPIEKEKSNQNQSSGPEWIDLLSESDSMPPDPYIQENDNAIDLEAEPWAGAPYVD